MRLFGVNKGINVTERETGSKRQLPSDRDVRCKQAHVHGEDDEVK